MAEIIRNFFEVAAGVLAVAGLAFCIYYIFLKRRLYIKGKSYLILDADGAGEQLEYYVRQVNAELRIDKIILYSGSGRENICELLARDYPNVKFCGGVIESLKLSELHEVDKCGE